MMGAPISLKCYYGLVHLKINVLMRKVLEGLCSCSGDYQIHASEHSDKFIKTQMLATLDKFIHQNTNANNK